jgi:tRNA A-37 threonylcarbamoyl transferase component Bud32
VKGEKTMRTPNVLSFDLSRINIVEENEIVVVHKRTTKVEYLQIKQASDYLKKNFFGVKEQSLRIRTAPIISWNSKDSILTTQYCKGDNIEEYLQECTAQERKMILRLFREFMSTMKEKGFLWGDLAPRNMVIDHNSNTLWLFDFERRLTITEDSVKTEDFSRFLRKYAFEELSCLFLQNEKEELFDGFLVEESGYVHTSDITSKRRKKLLSKMFGTKSKYSMNEIYELDFLMTFIATPYYINDSIFYPIRVIDFLSSKGGADVYVEIAYELKDLDEELRYVVLTQKS